MAACSRLESMNRGDRRVILLTREIEEGVFRNIYRFERILHREELMRRGIVVYACFRGVRVIP